MREKSLVIRPKFVSTEYLKWKLNTYLPVVAMKYRERLHLPLITTGTKASDTKRLCSLTVQGSLVSSVPNACALDICIWHRMRASSSLKTLNAEICCQLLFNLRTTGLSVYCSTPLQSQLWRSHWAYYFKRSWILIGKIESSCIPFTIPRICPNYPSSECPRISGLGGFC